MAEGFFFGRCSQTLFQFDLQQAIGEVLFPGFRVCSKLEGKLQFLGVFICSKPLGNLRGSLIYKGFCCKLLGKSSLGVFISSKPLGNFAFATCSDAGSFWETIGKIPCKLLGTSHFKGLSAASFWDNSICSVFSCAASYIGQEGNCNRQGCICTKPVGNLICRLLALHEVTSGFRAQPPPTCRHNVFITNPDGFCSCWQDDT